MPVKTTHSKSSLLFIACLFYVLPVFGQSSGRVVINEYMPWTSNGCGTTAEFVELLNFGPGPVDIGCYVLTTGKYAITIPPNTIIQPGDFYVIAGQDFIPKDCANIDSVKSGVTADLNWNSCNCTNVPIPNTGDGMMTDGGGSNTPLVLLDPLQNVIDAVVRSLPAEPSVVLKTSDVGGSCSIKTINLAQMPVVYEELGMSAGRANSFARVMDGDCGWEKDPQQSANASNNRSGDVSDIRYSFSLIRSTDCMGEGGRVSVFVEHNNYAAVFPMSYTVGTDLNRNGIFDESDHYQTFIDSTPPNIDVTGVPTGHYKITLSSAKGCYLKNFEFNILECFPVLPVKLEYFRYAGQRNGSYQLQWKLHDVENLQKLVVQKAKKNGQFIDDDIIEGHTGVSGSRVYSAELKTGAYEYFRLRIITKTGAEFYSPVISVQDPAALNTSWPNPASDILNVQLVSAAEMKSNYAIINASGMIVARGQLAVRKGQSVYTLPIAQLQPGLHQLQFSALNSTAQPVVFRFIKL